MSEVTLIRHVTCHIKHVICYRWTRGMYQGGACLSEIPICSCTAAEQGQRRCSCFRQCFRWSSNESHILVSEKEDTWLENRGESSGVIIIYRSLAVNWLWRPAPVREQPAENSWWFPKLLLAFCFTSMQTTGLFVPDRQWAPHSSPQSQNQKPVFVSLSYQPLFDSTQNTICNM